MVRSALVYMRAEAEMNSHPKRAVLLALVQSVPAGYFATDFAASAPRMSVGAPAVAAGSATGTGSLYFARPQSPQYMSQMELDEPSRRRMAQAQAWSEVAVGEHSRSHRFLRYALCVANRARTRADSVHNCQ
jgi:hypothetical protein